MKKIVIFLILIFLIKCNGDMIEKAVNSTIDPRYPEINIKYKTENITNGGNCIFEFENGININETSEEQTFIIENIGTFDLNIIDITLSGENSDE